MNWKGKNIFITGADGFIASWIAKKLIELEANVTVVIREPEQKNALDLLEIRKKVNIIKGDILDLEGIKKIFNNNSIEYCFHLAAQAIVGNANSSPLQTFEANIKGTWNMLEAARSCKTLTAIIVASSDKAYGDQKIIPYVENQPLNGLYPYDASKSCTDILARCYFKTFLLPVAVTRCANIYGGGDAHTSRIVPGTILSLMKGEIPVIRSDGTLERDYMYIEDAVNAYLVLAENIDKAKGEAFNFGTQDPVSVLEIFKKIISVYGSKIEPKIKGSNKGEIVRQSLKIEKARKILNWEPKISLEEGLKRTIDWYKNNKLGD